MAKGAAGARDARHDSADRDVEDVGDVFVLDLFNVAQEQSFAKWRRKLLERGVKCSLVVEAYESVFGGGTGSGSVECVGMVFEKNSA